MPISSSASRNAVSSGVFSPSSHAPPGNETCPLCDSTLSVRRVNSKCHSSSCHTSGTSTAAHLRRVSSFNSTSEKPSDDVPNDSMASCNRCEIYSWVSFIFTTETLGTRGNYLGSQWLRVSVVKFLLLRGFYSTHTRQ